MQQVDIYSKGIPRILHYITEALLSTKRKLTTKKSIISFIEDDCLQLQKISDLVVSFVPKWRRDCFLRLLLFAVLEIPISIRCKFKVPQSYSFKEIPVLELIANMNIFHEKYGSDDRGDDIVKLLIPKYTLLLLRKYGLLAQEPSFVISEHLLSRNDVLDKGKLLQELTLQCLVAHFIAQKSNAILSKNQLKPYSKY